MESGPIAPGRDQRRNEGHTRADIRPSLLPVEKNLSANLSRPYDAALDAVRELGNETARLGLQTLNLQLKSPVRFKIQP